MWQVRLGDGWLHVLVPLEFQSRDDPDMALRILEYTALLYRELARNHALARDGLRPPGLPVVICNGAAHWTAASDPDRLADIGDWLVRCDTGEEFLARAIPSADEAEG